MDERRRTSTLAAPGAADEVGPALLQVEVLLELLAGLHGSAAGADDPAPLPTTVRGCLEEAAAEVAAWPETVAAVMPNPWALYISLGDALAAARRP